MVVIVAVARRRGFAPDPRGVVCLAASVFMLVDPGIVGHSGALLSFAAAFGIVHLEELLRARIRYAGLGADLFRASIAAWLATAPILANLGVPLAPLAPLTNLVAVPLGIFLTVYGLALVALAAITPEAAALASPPFELGAWALDGLAQLAASAPALEGLALPPLAAGFTGLAIYHVGACAIGASRAADSSSTRRAEGPGKGPSVSWRLWSLPAPPMRGAEPGGTQAASSSLS
jgi:predicted membrane metal-binding protein